MPNFGCRLCEGTGTTQAFAKFGQCAKRIDAWDQSVGQEIIELRKVQKSPPRFPDSGQIELRSHLGEDLVEVVPVDPDRSPIAHRFARSLSIGSPDEIAQDESTEGRSRRLLLATGQGSAGRQADIDFSE
jgi:hypothetical protein